MVLAGNRPIILHVPSYVISLYYTHAHIHVCHCQGCESHGTHVASCCDAPPDEQNSTGFVCAAPSSGEDYRGYDWFNGTAPDATANLTASSEIIAASAEQYIASHAGPAHPPIFLYLPFQCVSALQSPAIALLR